MRWNLLCLGILFSFLLTSCAGVKTARKKEHYRTEKPVIAMDTSDSDTDRDPGLGASAKEIENLTIEKVISGEEPNTQNLYDNSRYDFPITVNSRVEGWIDYFTGRGKPHMERYLSRSGRYIPLMKKTLRKNGLPEDLVYLALIESGFNLRANSRARAVGPWQFMKATGQRYGLHVDAWIDQRRDPIRSTEAAAMYLKDLYLMFESWYLAASAYNAGEYKILRAIENLKTNNYWRICETRLIRRETKDYVPKLIAAAIIAKNPARYGFEEVNFEEPLDFETVTVDFPVHLKELAKIVDTDEEEMLDLNPELRRGIVPPNWGPYEVRVPVGSRTLVDRAIGSLRTKLAASELPSQYIARAGDTLQGVANKFKLRKNELANANNMSPKEKLKAGTNLLIPNKKEKIVASRPPREPVQRSGADVAVGAGFVVHVVRKGESLWSISEKYNVTVQDLYKWNSLKKRNLMPGKRLRVKSDKGGQDEA